MLGFMKKYIPVWICLFILIVIGIVFLNIDGNNKTQIEANRGMISELENKIEVHKAALQQSNENTLRTVTGVDSERRSSDETAFTQFITSVFDWSTYNEYMNRRNEIMRKYNMDDGSEFMKSFMPRVKEFDKGDGTKTNMIDSGQFNMNFSNKTTYLVDIEGEYYKYISLVEVRTTNSSGGEASGSVMVMFKTDRNSAISDVDAELIAK